jgi:hypothetical protein
MYRISITEPSLEHSQPVESLLSVSRTRHARGAQLGAGFRCTRLIGGAVRRVCPGVNGGGSGGEGPLVSSSPANDGVPKQVAAMGAYGKDGFEGGRRRRS